MATTASRSRGGLAAGPTGKVMHRNNSYQSSFTSGHESNASGSEMNSRSEGSSRKTPSEYSLPTPDDNQPVIDQFYFGMEGGVPTFTIETPRIKRLSDDSSSGQQSLSYIRPEMLASLTAQYDYKLNRYHSVTAMSDLQHFDEEFEDESSEGGEEFDIDFEESDLYTPIEIARPVSLVIPTQRPAVVSISPRSPTFSRASMDSPNSLPHSRSSSIEQVLIPAPRKEEAEGELQQEDDEDEEEVEMEDDEEEEDGPLSAILASYARAPEPEMAPTPPPKRSTLRMNSLRSLIRNTSSQLLDIKEEKATGTTYFSRRNSIASSIHSRTSESSRNFDLGAFITSPPTPKGTTGPSLVIPARSTSVRGTKAQNTSPTAPPLTPRNPRRHQRHHSISEQSRYVRNSISEETYISARGQWV